MLTAAEHDDMLACRDAIHRAFTKEAKKRGRHSGDAWILAERLAVTDAANAWAISHGRPPVLIAVVERVETRASGHVDYATKFALYVAELVYGVSP